MLFDFYPPNIEGIAVACSCGFPLPATSRFLPARPTHALRCFRYFKKLVVRDGIAVLELSTLALITDTETNEGFVEKTMQKRSIVCRNTVDQ